MIDIVHFPCNGEYLLFKGQIKSIQVFQGGVCMMIFHFLYNEPSQLLCTVSSVTVAGGNCKTDTLFLQKSLQMRVNAFLFGLEQVVFLNVQSTRMAVSY